MTTLSTPTLLEFMKTLPPDGLTAFASRADTSVGYLNQIAYGYKAIGPALAVKLAKASGGVLDAKILCPVFPWSDAADLLCTDCV